MFYLIGPLFLIVLLFGLCETEERALEFQKDFWIRNQKAMQEMHWGWSY